MPIRVLVLLLCQFSIAATSDLERCEEVFALLDMDKALEHVKAGRWLHGQRPLLHTWDLVRTVNEGVAQRARGRALQKPAEKISLWLEYMHLGLGTKGVREKFRERYLEENVLGLQDVPESHFELQRRVARDAGHGDITLTPELRRELAQSVVDNQRESLGAWWDYLASEDAKQYPAWARIFVLEEVARMGRFDSVTGKFSVRDKNQVASFPELNREALAKVISEMEKHAVAGGRRTFSFSEAYGRELKHSIKERGDLAVTEGLWVKYPKESSAEKLSQALSGWNTGWCTTDCGTAEHQLKGGDFYVYYSLDREGKPRVPRLAIRMEGEKIAEVRGIAKEQNVDSEIAATPILERKLKEFGGQGELYRKRSDHMRRLTAIEAKVKSEESLSPSDVSFLYEMEGPIEGFGYLKDPRIAEIRLERKNKGREDLAAFLAYFMEVRGPNSHNHFSRAEADAAATKDTALIAKSLEAKGVSDATALAALSQFKESLSTQNLSTVASLSQLVSDNPISGRFRRALADTFVANAHTPTRLAREVVRNFNHGNEAVRDFAKEVLAVSGDVIKETPLMHAFHEIERISHEAGVSNREAAEQWLSEASNNKELKAEYLRAHEMTSDFEALEAHLPETQKKSVLNALEKKSNALLFRKLALARGVPRELLPRLTAESFDFENFEFKRVGEKVTLGSRPDELGRFRDDENQREVTLTKPFGIGASPVTQLEWVLVTDEPNPSKFVNGPGAIEITLSDGKKTKVLPNHPVEKVSWNDVVTRFLPKLNQLDPKNYRLATEAEWEFAARAGTQTRYSHGDGEEDLSQYAWTDANAGRTTHAVAELKPNGFGLYDMHGNVWEWGNDRYTDDASTLGGVDPTGPKTDLRRVVRGGGWTSDARNSRSANRNGYDPASRNGNLGFRLVWTP